MFWFSVPCIRSHKSAGQFIVNFVMGLMVGDRRFPGATILGGRGSLLLPPTIPSQSRRLVQNIVMDSLSGLFWDFGSLCQRRRGVVSFTLSRQPSSSSTSLRRLRLGVTAQASGTFACFFHAGDRLRDQRLSGNHCFVMGCPEQVQYIMMDGQVCKAVWCVGGASR